MLIRAELAETYNYGTTPEVDDQWWRPVNFSHTSEVTTRFTESDIGTRGVTGLYQTTTQDDIP